jgi:hypothetical protein
MPGGEATTTDCDSFCYWATSSGDFEQASWWGWASIEAGLSRRSQVLPPSKPHDGTTAAWYSTELRPAWCLRHCALQDADQANACKVASFSSVEGFWAVQNHMKRAQDIGSVADICMFREGEVRPSPCGVNQPSRGLRRRVHQDPNNVCGGSIRFVVPGELISRLWEDVILALVGGQFDSNVSGAGVAVREGKSTISLWVRGDELEQRERIQRQLQVTRMEGYEIRTSRVSQWS